MLKVLRKRPNLFESCVLITGEHCQNKVLSCVWIYFYTHLKLC